MLGRILMTMYVFSFKKILLLFFLKAFFELVSAFGYKLNGEQNEKVENIKAEHFDYFLFYFRHLNSFPVPTLRLS